MTPTQTTPLLGTMTMGEIYYVLFRHKWTIVVAMVLGMVAAWYVYQTTPPTYRSNAKLLVRYVTDNSTLDPSTRGEHVTTPDRTGKSVINSETEILSSRDLIETIVDSTGAEPFVEETQTNATLSARVLGRILSGLGIETPKDSSPRMMAIASIVRHLTIVVPKDTSVIQVAYEGPSAALSQEVLSRLIDGYLRKHREVHRTAGVSDFLSQQTEEIRRRIMQIDDELRQLKAETGIKTLGDNRNFLVARLEETQQALQDVEASLAASRARMETLVAETPRIPPLQVSRAAQPAANADNVLPRTTAVANVHAEEALRGLQMKEAELLATYTEDSLPVQGVRRQIREVKKLLQAQTWIQAVSADTNRVDALPVGNVAQSSLAALPEDPRVKALKTQLEEARLDVNMHDGGEGRMAGRILDEAVNVAGLDARAGVLRAQLEQAKSDAEARDAVEGRIAALTGLKAIQEANYKYFAENLDQARINDALDLRKISNISIVQPATFPMRRERSGLWRNMALALALGLFGGLGLAFVREYRLDRTLKHPGEVTECLKAPLLISIPWMQHLSSPERRDEARSAAEWGKTADGRRLAAETRMADYYEALRDRILMSVPQPAGKPLVLGLTSCAPASGCTTLAAGLALALARNGTQRVFLLDADGRQSGSNRLFGVDPSSGLTDLRMDSEGNTALVQHQLYLVPADHAESAKLPISRTQQLSQLVHRLRESEMGDGIVIVDLPPVTEISVTLRIARQMDGVVLVIGAEQVDRARAESVRNMLLQANAKIVGAILNKRRSYVPMWLHAQGWANQQ